jgi:hypothetical protein
MKDVMGSNIRINKVREILREHPDGLTVVQITELAGTSRSHIHRMINKFPDAYIDRWIKKKNSVSAVWCVVVPPPHCPKPKTK